MSATCLGDDKFSVFSCLRQSVSNNDQLELIGNREKYKDLLQEDVRLFSFRSIKKATNNFTSKLGYDRYSDSYEATPQNRSLVVQVFPQYNTVRREVPDFISLVNTMSEMRHRNVAGFIGCCIEGEHRIVVYEFMGRQSLDQLFRSNTHSLELSWRRRASICVGVASGLDYLHNGMDRRVVHRDIKPSNVILDENCNPKISPNNKEKVSVQFSSQINKEKVIGTTGYMCPDYGLTGLCTEKVDVYGFGVLLLEVISGRKAIEHVRDVTGFHLLEWVREQQENDRTLDIIDPNLAEFPEDEVIRFIDIALSCVQISPELRPSMSEVLLMLSGGYDFNENAVRKPQLLVDDKNLGEIEIPSGSNVSSTDKYHKASLSEIISVGSGVSAPAADTKGKMICESEIQIEDDPESKADSEAELMHMSQDLTELYSSFKKRIPGAITESVPSYRTVLKPELMSSSSESNVLVPKGEVEVKEQILQGGLERSIEPEIHDTDSISAPSLETSAEPQLIATSAQVTHTFIQSEVINELPLQEEIEDENEALSPTKVDMDRPINRTIHKIFDALEDAQSRIIGLHGRSGSGKTTVLKTLFRDHFAYFDHVIFVTVPRLAHPRMIQNEIMQQLSLTIPEDCYSGNEIAALIFQVFTRKKILLLLDDVWETINLRDIGIPVLGVNDSFCLIFATRSLDVCHAMADRGVEMEALSKLEAWGLFCNQMGSVVDSSEIEPYAKAIVEECHGLPLIISAVASALRSKTSVVEWKFALWSFQIPDACNADDPYSVSPQIKYCYHKLKERDVKTCFLYSALFPADKEIDISMLVECFIAEGLLGGRTVVSNKRGHDIIEQLINARLLEATDNDGTVKMLNVIRDSALAILSSDVEGYQVLTRYYLSPSTIIAPSKRVEVQKYLTGAGAQLKEPPALEEWTTAEMIFLMDNEFSRLPDEPTCPNLQALFLQRNSCLRVIPTSFFDGMSGLRILNLSKTRIKSLPDSFLTLENLEVLAMRDCERFLTLPPSIGLLKALQVLDLEGTELTHLPDSISELARLKNLRVSFYGSMSNCTDLPEKLIPDKTIMTLDLQELGIFVHPGDRRWASCVSNIIEEINNLKLSSLCFHFPEIDHLDLFLKKNQSWTNGDLTMFNFIVGRDFQHGVSRVPYDAEMMYSGEERCLRYVNGEDITLAVPMVLSRITSLYLDHHLSVCSLSDFGIERMHTLKICILRDCPQVTTIIDKDSGTTVLPFLEYLSINYLWNLEQIWTAYLGMGSLAKLKYLSMHACPKLRYVFTCDMLDMFPNLEELVIEDCAMLEYIVFEDTLARSPPSPVLRNLKVLKLHYMPQLSGLWKGCWPSLEYISFYNCPKLKNLHLLANDAININEIAAEKTWWDLLEWDDTTMSTRLQELVTQIQIDDL